MYSRTLMLYFEDLASSRRNPFIQIVTKEDFKLITAFAIPHLGEDSVGSRTLFKGKSR